MKMHTLRYDQKLKRNKRIKPRITDGVGDARVCYWSKGKKLLKM